MSAIPSVSADAAHESAPLSTLARRSSLSIPASAHTFEGFVGWTTSDHFPDHVSASWLKGDVFIDMSPEEIQSHARLRAAISSVIHDLAENQDLGLFAIEGTQLINQDVGLCTDSDGMFVSWESIEKGSVSVREPRTGRYTAFLGSPDWVLEVVSESSVDKDRRILKELYHAAKAKEFWLIDGQGAEIQIEIYQWNEIGYVALPVNNATWQSPVFGCRFELSRARGRYGFWKYKFSILP